MTSEAAVHQRNLESNILFMQQEHANTLKCLHEEIEKLQKKCSGWWHIMHAFLYAFFQTQDDTQTHVAVTGNQWPKHWMIVNPLMETHQLTFFLQNLVCKKHFPRPLSKTLRQRTAEGGFCLIHKID